MSRPGLGRVERALLVELARDPLPTDELARRVERRPDQIRRALYRLRGRRLVDNLGTSSGRYALWRLTPRREPPARSLVRDEEVLTALELLGGEASVAALATRSGWSGGSVLRALYALEVRELVSPGEGPLWVRA